MKNDKAAIKFHIFPDIQDFVCVSSMFCTVPPISKNRSRTGKGPENSNKNSQSMGRISAVRAAHRLRLFSLEKTHWIKENRENFT